MTVSWVCWNRAAGMTVLCWKISGGFGRWQTKAKATESGRKVKSSWRQTGKCNPSHMGECRGEMKCRHEEENEHG